MTRKHAIATALRAATLAVVAMVALVAVSCSPDLAPTAPPAGATASDNLLGDVLTTTTKLVGGLLTCKPMPFVADSARIGPAGGLLKMGSHTLVIPRGALSSTIMIKGVAPSDTVSSVRFSPEGLHFATSATLTLSYANCNLVAGLLTPKRIVYTTDGLRVLEYLRSIDNILTRKVSAPLDHFSRYAVAW